VTVTDVPLIVVAITNYCSACDFIVTYVFPIDKFLIRNMARLDGESVSSCVSTLYVSENDAMKISVRNDTKVTITKSEADKVRHRNYKDDYITFGF
jgi:hypothetical protein